MDVKQDARIVYFGMMSVNSDEVGYSSSPAGADSDEDSGTETVTHEDCEEDANHARENSEYLSGDIPNVSQVIIEHGINRRMVQLTNNLVDLSAALVWVPIGILALSLLGLLLAPLAAVACVLVARYKGIEGSYGGEGAKSSALLVLPFVYLLTRLMFGRSPFPKPAVTTAYALIYVVWLILIAIHVVGLFLRVIDIVFVHNHPLAPTVAASTAYAIVLPFIVYTLWRSIREVHRADSPHGGAASELTSNGDSGTYLEPFIGVITWSIVTLIIVIAADLLGFVGH